MANVLLGRINGSAKASWKHTPKGPRKQSSDTWLVIAENQSTTEEQIRTTSGLPQLYAAGSGVYVVGVSAKQSNPTKHPSTGVNTWAWHVDIDYDSELDLNLTLNPISRAPEFSWEGTLETTRLVWDADTGELVQTAAGEPIFVPVPIVLPVLTAKKYYALGTFTAAHVALIGGASNSVAWRGIPVGNLQIQTPVVRESVIENVKYEEATFRFRIVYDRSDLTRTNMASAITLPHRGTQYLGPTGNVLRTHRDGTAGVFDLASDGKISDTPTEISFNALNKINVASIIGF